MNRADRGASRRLYVETSIEAPLPRLWRLTQDPRLHARWDLRFGSITPTAPGRFRYSTFGVHGIGTHAGTREHDGGAATSALRFASAHPLSPIAKGAGYWRYVPDGDRVRFLTGYDYTARHRWADPVVRPLMGWATAWSFDRLRLWAETGQSPRRSLLLALADLTVRLVPIAVAARRSPGLAAALVPLTCRPVPGRVPSARRCRRVPAEAPR